MKWRILETSLMRLAASVLALAGALKLITAWTNIPVLAYADPVLPFISTRLLLLLAGQTEIVFLVVIALRPESWLARYGLLALCATFLTYRAGLVVLDAQAPCPCLGRVTDWLRMTPQQGDLLALLLLGILAAIAVTSVVFHRVRQPNLRTA